MKTGRSWVMIFFVGGALLAPLFHETILLRFVADFFALGIAVALVTKAIQTLRGTAGKAAQQDPAVSIDRLTPGLPGTIEGKVITRAAQPSRLTDDAFVAVLGTVVRLEGNLDAQHTVLRSEVSGERIEVRDATGVAVVELDHLRIYGSLHRTLEWSGAKHDAVPNERVRAFIDGRPLQSKAQRRNNETPHLRYTEIVIRADDDVVVTGDVAALTERPGEAKGYRANATEWRAVLRGKKGSPVLVRSVSLAVVAANRERAVRQIIIAGALAAWGVLVWFLPVLF